MSDTSENTAPADATGTTGGQAPTSQDQATPAPSDGDDTSTTPEMTREEALAELAKARQEREELAAAAEKWKQHEDSQKTELQKIQEQNAELARQLQEQSQRTLVLDVASKHGIPAEDLDLLGTGDEATLTARAARIKELREAAVKRTPVPGQTPTESWSSGTGASQNSDDDSAYPTNWLPPAAQKKLKNRN